MRVYHDSDADPGLIKTRNVALIGYGSQGRSQALNLRDSGVKHLKIGVRSGSPSAKKAAGDGLEISSMADAAKWADVIVMLTPDETQAEIYAKDIAPNLKQGASLAFAHGFNVRFGFITPRADLDVWEIAPKDTGAKMRERYEEGQGVACLAAVHQDASKNALKLALSYGAAIGAGRAGITETTFAEECEADLFGEQAVFFGGVVPLMRAGFETMVEAGYPPEMAYFRCVQQVKLVTDAIAARGIAGMNEIISNTAEYGGYVAGPKLVTAETKKEMKRLLDDIRSGAFAKAWMEENKNGASWFRAEHEKAAKHPMEPVGAAVRASLKPKP